jgi:hypothetical protein
MAARSVTSARSDPPGGVVVFLFETVMAPVRRSFGLGLVAVVVLATTSTVAAQSLPIENINCAATGFAVCTIAR